MEDARTGTASISTLAYCRKDKENDKIMSAEGGRLVACLLATFDKKLPLAICRRSTKNSQIASMYTLCIKSKGCYIGGGCHYHKPVR